MSSQNLPRALPNDWAKEVLHFWFEELPPPDWFKRDAQLDERIRRRFADLRAALAANPPAPSSLDAPTVLATVLVFDQFSRNLFRESAAAYEVDAQAQALAKHAVATGMDRSLNEQQRHFLYMPFMHSEDRGMQAESVRLFTALGSAEGVKWAEHHRGIVERFGRFPHRNAILGRQSTPEELEFLQHRNAILGRQSTPEELEFLQREPSFA
jgi:uncharacterized protein (DUF924 family)